MEDTIDRAAFRYFGIICFRDMPGYFPQLDKTEQQNKNLKDHVAAVLERLPARGQRP